MKTKCKACNGTGSTIDNPKNMPHVIATYYPYESDRFVCWRCEGRKEVDEWHEQIVEGRNEALKKYIDDNILNKRSKKHTKERVSQRLTSLHLNFEQLEDKVAKQQQKIAEQAEEINKIKPLLGKIYAQLKGCEWLNKPKRKRGDK